MAKQFDVVISPGVTKKSSPKDVAALLARQLKIDHAKAYKWVTGKNPVTIVKATSQETASQYVKAITATGALAKAVVHKPGANAKVAGAAKAASGGGRSPLGHPLIVAILSGLVSLAGGWFGLQYWQEMELERIRMTPPTSEAREAAEITAAAFGLYMTGNGDMATELADLLQRMRGKNTEQLQSEQNIVIDMMKGLGVDEFIRMVSGADIQGRQGRSDTMQGVSSFTRSELELIGPSLLTHGYESLLHRVALRQEIPDLKNPGRMLQISTLDKVTDDELKPSLAIFNIDQEWDLYMLSLTDAFLKNERPGEAKSLAEKIMNPVIRAQALGKIVVYFQFRRQPEKLVAEYLRLIENTLINLPDPASAITVRIDIARQLADAGDQAEPARTYNQVRKAVAEEKNVYIRPLLWGRLANILFDTGDVRGAYNNLAKGLETVDDIEEKVERLAVYVKLARNYFDVRKPTLAHEILKEAAAIASAELQGSQQARIFGEIALSRGYMGDLQGAVQAAAIASSGDGRNQLLRKLAQVQIERGYIYQAAETINLIGSGVHASQALFRLVSRQIHNGDIQSALYFLSRGEEMVSSVEVPEIKAMITGQLARLYFRAGEEKKAGLMFAKTMLITNQLAGLKADLSLASVALDQVRSFNVEGAENSKARIQKVSVRDAVGKEISRIQTILLNNLPRNL